MRHGRSISMKKKPSLAPHDCACAPDAAAPTLAQQCDGVKTLSEGRRSPRGWISVLGWSSGQRLAWAAGAAAGLWLAVAWALDWM
jgi:hypothetical protein